MLGCESRSSSTALVLEHFETSNFAISHLSCVCLQELSALIMYTSFVQIDMLLFFNTTKENRLTCSELSWHRYIVSEVSSYKKSAARAEPRSIKQEAANAGAPPPGNSTSESGATTAAATMSCSVVTVIV